MKPTNEMKEDLYTPNKIRTFSGIYIDPLNPKPDDICIVDIAHSLSMLCRFNGHTKRFFSVAEHSINVSKIVPDHLKLQALLHDASEAYLSDVPKPYKDRVPGYSSIEENLMIVIAQKYEFGWPLSPEVKKADKIELEWEWNTRMISDKSFHSNPHMNERNFLKLYREYSKLVKEDINIITE